MLWLQGDYALAAKPHLPATCRETIVPKSCLSDRFQWLPGVVRLKISAALILGLNLSANAIETVTARCEHGTSVEAAIEACSTIVNTDKDHHRLAIAHFNRAGWHLKKDEVDLAASDLSEAIRFEPDFAAALTERGLVEERLNNLRSARAGFAAVLKLPQTNNSSEWAHAKARERLAATEAAVRGVANPTPTAATPNARASASDFWRRPLAQVLQECNAKPAPGRSL
jgi:hypothetical protein